jgi:hypothetical protein
MRARCAVVREQKVTETSTFGGTTYRFPANEDTAANAVNNLRSRDSPMLAHFPVLSQSMLLAVEVGSGMGLLLGAACVLISDCPVHHSRVRRSVSTRAARVRASARYCSTA